MAKESEILTEVLARWSYRIAFMGPVALILLAMYFGVMRDNSITPKAVPVIFDTIGALSLLGSILGLVSVVLVRKLRVSKARVRRAVAGIVLGPVSVCAYVIGSPSLKTLASTDITGQVMSCKSNAKQIDLALMMYAQINDEFLPPSGQWTTSIDPYTKNRRVFECPQVSGHISTYAVNRLLFGHKLTAVKDAAKTVLLFECKPGVTLTGGLVLATDPDRHMGKITVCFVDGHVESIPVDELPKLTWIPEFTVTTPESTNDSR